MKFRNYCRNKVMPLIEYFRETGKLPPALAREARLIGTLTEESKGQKRKTKKTAAMASERNFLMPVESVFQRDNPLVGKWGRANPDNFALTLIFVVITPLTSLWEVWKTFPILKAMLEHKYKSGSHDVKDRTETKGGIDHKELKASFRGNQPELGDPEGYGMGAAMTDAKWRAVASIWSKRKTVYGHCQPYMSETNPDPVMMVDGLLTSRLPGMDIVKASFATQMLMGKLGCIDVHNHNIYRSHFLNRYSSEDAEKKIATLDPWQSAYSMTDAERKSLTPKMQERRLEKIGNYVGALNMLSEEGFTTGALWDIWCNYVAHYWGEGMYNAEMGPGVSAELEHMKKVSGMRVNYILSGQEMAHLRPTYGLSDFEGGLGYDQANKLGPDAKSLTGIERWINVYRKGKENKVATTVYRDAQWKKTLQSWLDAQDLDWDQIVLDPPDPDNISDSDPESSRLGGLAKFDPRFRLMAGGKRPNSMSWDSEEEALGWAKKQLDANAYYWDGSVVRKAKMTDSKGEPSRSASDKPVAGAPTDEAEARMWIAAKRRGLDTAKAERGGWSPSQEAGRLINPAEPHPSGRAVGMAHRLDLMDPLGMAKRHIELGRKIGDNWDDKENLPGSARDYHRFLSRGGEGEEGQASMVGSLGKMTEKPMKGLYFYWRNPDMALNMGLSEPELDDIQSMLRQAGVVKSRTWQDNMPSRGR